MAQKEKFTDVISKNIKDSLDEGLWGEHKKEKEAERRQQKEEEKKEHANPIRQLYEATRTDKGPFWPLFATLLTTVRLLLRRF